MDNIGFADYNLLDQTVRILKPDPEYRKSIAFDGKGKHVHLPDNLSFISIDIALLAEYRCRIYISKFPVAIDRPPHSMPAQHLYYPQRSFCSGGRAGCHHSHNVQVIESTFNQNDVGIRLIDTLVYPILGIQPAGQYIDRQYAAYWDGRNEQGELVSSGVYWYHLHTANTHPTKQLVILK